MLLFESRCEIHISVGRITILWMTCDFSCRGRGSSRNFWNQIIFLGSVHVCTLLSGPRIFRPHLRFFVLPEILDSSSFHRRFSETLLGTVTWYLHCLVVPYSTYSRWLLKPQLWVTCHVHFLVCKILILAQVLVLNFSTFFKSHFASYPKSNQTPSLHSPNFFLGLYTEAYVHAYTSIMISYDIYRVVDSL